MQANPIGAEPNSAIRFGQGFQGKNVHPGQIHGILAKGGSRIVTDIESSCSSIIISKSAHDDRLRAQREPGNDIGGHIGGTFSRKIHRLPGVAFILTDEKPLFGAGGDNATGVAGSEGHPKGEGTTSV